MAQGLYAGLGIPLPVGYLLSTVVVIPIVIYGMRAWSVCSSGRRRCGWSWPCSR